MSALLETHVNQCRLGYKHGPDPDWFDWLDAGHVICERGGAWRIVRQVSRRTDGRLSFVTLVIRRRSWTGRCYTVLTSSDLKTRVFTVKRDVRVKPKTLIDVRIAQAIKQRCYEPYIITADEVIGMP